jgi:CheY-like chemotaxis protein
MHALIIEDDELIAIAIEEVLMDCGFTSFDFAASADEAVASATQRCPDLITADVELSPGSGIEAVQTICANDLIPVIFITGRADEARVQMPQHSVLDKPFRVADVETAVQRVMGI